MEHQYLIPLVAYFLGAIPFGYLLVRFTEGTDIRSEGSGNIGATNVFRKNRWAGTSTLVLDAGKGYLAVLAAGWLGGNLQWQAAAAAAAIVGHTFTVFLCFKGGKGVATGAGAYLALSPAALCTTVFLFIVVVLTSRYVSLGSILAAASFPLFAYLFHEPDPVLFWSIAGAVIIVARHHENIRRILSGNENKFAWGGRS